MEDIQPTLISVKPAQSASISVQTTLFDLIHARQAELEPGDDRRITHEVLELLQSGRVTRCGEPEPWTQLLEAVESYPLR